MASVNAGMDDQGHYGELVYTGCATQDRAKEIVRALHRSAHHLKVSVTAKVEKHGKEFDIRYHAIDKAVAQRYVVSKYGTDRSAWPYNPRKRGG